MRGAAVYAFTPSANWNTARHIDDMWTDLHFDIVYADQDVVDLARTLVRPELPQDGSLTKFFHTTYGERYNFSQDRPPANLYMGPGSTKPRSIQQVEDTVNTQLAAWLATPGIFSDRHPFHNPGPFNSTQVIGYLPGVELPWHTDGEPVELGPVSALLQLGGDAELRIRQQRNAPEIIIPLLHGSMVLFLGFAFSQFYEVCFYSPSAPPMKDKTMLTASLLNSTR